MTGECFMYGDLAALTAPPEPIATVLLIGFQGQRKVLTGTMRELSREFFCGSGGTGCNGVEHVGWEYWSKQDLGTPDHLAVVSDPIQNIIDRKGLSCVSAS